MKKLVTALMVVLPLLFLVALFTVTNVTRITTDIPATGISISNKGDNGIFSFDIADYDNPMYEEDLGIDVLPLIASNREYTLSVTDAQSGEASNLVTLNDDGSFALNDIGVAKLTYTSKDGGYSDSVLFNISSSGVLRLTAPTLTDALGNQCSVEEGEDTDYVAHIQSGAYQLGATYYPANISSAQPHFVSQNPYAIDLNEVSGRMHAMFGGKHVVEISITDAHNDIITKTLAINVQKCADITLNGMDIANQLRISAPLDTQTFTIYLDANEQASENNISLAGTNCARYAVRKLDEISQTAYAIDITLENVYQDEASSSYILTIGAQQYRFAVDFANYDFKVYSQLNLSGDGELLMFEGIDTRLSIVAEPYNSNITYQWSVDDEYRDILQIKSQDNGYCVITPLAVGNAKVKITCAYGNSIVVEERDVVVTKRYTSLIFGESVQTHGMGSFAIAKYAYSGENIVLTPYLSAFSAYDGKDKAQTYQDIIFTSSNNAIATIEQSGQDVLVNIKTTGDVTITAQCKYSELLGIAPVSFTFTAVDGIKVNDYAQLVSASKANRQIVLANDIYLGEELFDKHQDGSRTAKYDNATMREKLLQYTTELNTTADWTYYKNMGEAQPTVRYCFEFTNNVYGNGHVLSGEYLTNTLDSTDIPYDYAVFKGPLDFVSTSMDGIKVAAVKGQDNIVFLIRKDNIRVDNAILKGCDDESLYDNGEFNLSLLNNMGTTLEVMSNATITNCRIMNGRTVLRAFGRYGIDANSTVSTATEKINVTVDGCILQNAREFLLKIGTNRMILGTDDNPEPYLYNQNAQPYTNHNKSACDDYINDDYFVNTYILTDVTLKDSILRTSGLFSVGIESHFAGPMLSGGGPIKLDGWYDLAATSYPAMLHLVGDVKLADWKQLSAVDSSTLIETAASNGSNLAFLQLNINQMLQTVQQYGGSQYENIIDNIDGENYVHGGIAFYGGGKNYSILDMSQYTFERMNQYNININILANSPDEVLNSQGTLLPAAAGSQDFRFVMFDASSQFDYNAQQQM